jgi:hypothetical protein
VNRKIAGLTPGLTIFEEHLVIFDENQSGQSSIRLLAVAPDCEGDQQ